MSVGHPQIQHAATFQIGEYRPHRRSRFAILPEGSTRIVPDFLKGSVVLVVEEEVLRAVVGDVNVIPSVVVEIRRRHAHGAAHISADARLVGHIRKGSIAVIVIELIGFALVIQRSRIVGRRVEGAILGVKLYIAAHKQIDTSILVVVQPGGADRPAVHLDAGLLGHIGKVAIAVVVIENRLSVAGHQQIDIAVVVIVGRRHRHSVHIRIESGLLRNIGKVAVAVVTIKVIMRRRCRFLFQRIGMHRVIQRPSVHYVKRLPPGVVVVEPDAARARTLQQRSQLPRPKAVDKVDARLVAGVFKANHRRRRGRGRMRGRRCLRRGCSRRWRWGLCRRHGNHAE